MAFVLDSTWALITTAGALAVHAVAVAQNAPGNYVRVAQRAPRPPRLRPGVEVSTRLPDDDRQRRQRQLGRREPTASSRSTSRSTSGRPAGSVRCTRCCTAPGPLLGAVAGAIAWVAGGRQRPVRSSGRGVVVLPQPIRVVGVQPRTTLAATASARRPRLATTHLPSVNFGAAASTFGRINSAAVGSTPSGEFGGRDPAADELEHASGGPVEQGIDRVAMLGHAPPAEQATPTREARRSPPPRCARPARQHATARSTPRHRRSASASESTVGSRSRHNSACQA